MSRQNKQIGHGQKERNATSLEQYTGNFGGRGDKGAKVLQDFKRASMLAPPIFFVREACMEISLHGGIVS